jgi:hypothetical protein
MPDDDQGRQERVGVSLRIPRTLFDAIEERRRKEYSTRHAYLIQLLKRGLESAGEENP